MAEEHRAKRQRLDEQNGSAAPFDTGSQSGIEIPKTLHRAISPPPSSKARSKSDSTSARQVLPSPFRLTKIRDLGPDLNVDTVSLADLLGDPLISECWQFNYLHDIDFLMPYFDDDTRGLVDVHIVHGSWKREDQCRINLQVRNASASRPCCLHMLIRYHNI